MPYAPHGNQLLLQIDHLIPEAGDQLKLQLHRRIPHLLVHLLDEVQQLLIKRCG